MESLNSIELYDISHWNRATIADGNFLSAVTIYPLSANDYTLLDAIDVYQNNTSEVAEINHQRHIEIRPSVDRWNADLRDGINPNCDSYNDTYTLLKANGPQWDDTVTDVETYSQNWDDMVYSAHSGYAASAYLLDPGLNASKVLNSAFYYCANDGKQNWFNDKKHSVYNHSVYIGHYDPDTEQNVVTNWSFGIGCDSSIKGSTRTTSCCNDHSFAILGASAGVSDGDIKGRSVNHHYMQCGMNTIGANWTGFYQGWNTIKGNSHSLIHGMNSTNYNTRCIYLSEGPANTVECVMVKGHKNSYNDTTRQFLIGDCAGTHHNKNTFAILFDGNSSAPVYSTENTFSMGSLQYAKNMLTTGGYTSNTRSNLTTGLNNGQHTDSLLVGNRIGGTGSVHLAVGRDICVDGVDSLIVGQNKYISSHTAQVLDLATNTNNNAVQSILMGREYSTQDSSYQNVFLCKNTWVKASQSDAFIHTDETSGPKAPYGIIHGRAMGDSETSYSLALGVKGRADGLSYSILMSSNYLPYCDVVGMMGNKYPRQFNLRYSGSGSFIMSDFSFTFNTAYEKPNSNALTGPTDYNEVNRYYSLYMLHGYEILNSNSFRDFIVGRSDKQTGGGVESYITSYHSYHKEDELEAWTKYNVCVGDFVRHTYSFKTHVAWKKLHDFSKSYYFNIGNNTHDVTASTGEQYYVVSDCNFTTVGTANKLGLNNATGNVDNPKGEILHNMVVGNSNTLINVVGSECIVVGKNNFITIPWATCAYVQGGNNTLTAKMICIGESCNTNKTMKRRCLGVKHGDVLEFSYTKSNTVYEGKDYLTQLIESIKGSTTDEETQTKRAAYFLASQNVIISKSDGPYFVATTCPSMNGSNKHGVYFRKSDNKWYDVKTNTAIT